MDYKVLKWQMLRASVMKRLLLRAFMFGTAMLMFSLIQMAHQARQIEPFMSNFSECALNFGFKSDNPYLNLTGFFKPASFFPLPFFRISPMSCEESENMTKDVFGELMEKGMLTVDTKALCLGDGSASAITALRQFGVLDAVGVDKHPFFSLLKRRFVYELEYKDDYFDFVFSRDLDRVSVPALLVHEIERVLRPGGFGAMFVGSDSFYSRNLVRSATPLSSFLKSSDVVHVCGVGSFTLVIFKKRFATLAAFDNARLPSECPAVSNNQPFMKYIEPLVDQKQGQLDLELSYLPNYMNISSRKRLVYINVGAGEFANATVAKIFEPYYRVPHQVFNVFVIDHKTSVLSSYVKNPGITFVYHPGLAGDDVTPDLTPDEYLSAPLDGTRFDFISWFEETIEDGDFVVLMMNAKPVELDILGELLKTGAMCHVDELFLRCSQGPNCKAAICDDCTSLIKNLRNSGVFAHQWLGD